MNEKMGRDIPPACNPECKKMREMGIPNDIYKRCLFHLSAVAADQSGLTNDQKSVLLANINSLQKAFDQHVIAKVFRRVVALFTEPLQLKITQLEAEIESLKEKHFEEIQNRISTIEDISKESISAIGKAGAESVEAIQTSSATVSEMKNEVSKKIRSAVQSVQQDMKAKTADLRSKANASKLKACIDELTGLPNKSGIVEYLRKTLPDAISAKRNMTLIFLDIDKFKTINDNYGETVGDQAIKLVANEGIKIIVDKNLDPKHCFCARFQGNKFAVIINDPDLRNAMRIAELIRMKSRILSSKLSEETGVYIYNTLKLSIGIAQTDYALQNLQKVILTLITKTNAALLKAKKKGGNRVISEE